MKKNKIILLSSLMMILTGCNYITPVKVFNKSKKDNIKKIIDINPNESLVSWTFASYSIEDEIFFPSTGQTEPCIFNIEISGNIQYPITIDNGILKFEEDEDILIKKERGFRISFYTADTTYIERTFYFDLPQERFITTNTSDLFSNAEDLTATEQFNDNKIGFNLYDMEYTAADLGQNNGVFSFYFQYKELNQIINNTITIDNLSSRDNSIFSGLTFLSNNFYFENMYNDFSIPLVNDFLKNVYDNQQDIGYNTGYNAGYNTGYNEGYNTGYNAGQSDANTLFEEPFSFLRTMASGIQSILNVRLIGPISIGLIISIPVLFYILKFVLGIFR